MKKKEFMDELKAALDGNVSTQVYYDTINYYEDYFKKRREAGESEEDICASLGSARIIAKTIIDTKGQGASGQYYDAGSAGYSSASGRSKSSKKGWHVNEDEYGKQSLAFGSLDFGTTFGKIVLAILAILVVALIISIVIVLVGVGIKILWYIVIPIVGIICIINLLIYFFGGGR